MIKRHNVSPTPEMHHTCKIVLPLACAALALSPSPVTAREVVLTDAPGSNWVVDNGDDSCRLVRELGEGSDRVTLMLTQWAPGEKFSLTLTGRPLRRFDQRTIMLAFADRDGPLGRRPVDFMEGKLGETDDVLVASSAYLTRPPEGDAEKNVAASTAEAPDPQSPYGTVAPRLAPGAIALADRIELSQGIDTLRLQPTRLADALGVLDACSQSRLPEWGLDPIAHQTMIQRPKLQNAEALVTKVQQNYPLAAVMRNEQADLHMRMLVDEAGTASDCTVIAGSRNDRITTDACELFANEAVFLPALDTTGKPMTSFFTTSILFRLHP
ncbi:energy transducer TonB [Croceibacterium ferulae]|uniref:energy transducer TonB n=1 Tax=Croceibacterium ferulae TaxID=1854641 RepID=UPI000F89208E|nr:energy transducer TonB [Croceibacterium ferulae]